MNRSHLRNKFTLRIFEGSDCRLEDSQSVSEVGEILYNLINGIGISSMLEVFGDEGTT